MFLAKNNSFLWKRLLLAGGAAGFVVILGFIGLDEFLHPFFRSCGLFLWSWLDVIFQWRILAALALIVFLIARAFRWKKARDISGGAFLSVILAEFVVAGLKFIFGRSRPVFYEAIGKTAFHPLSASASDAFHSFPSGHTAAAFALAAMLALAFPKYKWLCFCAAAVVGFSRLAFGAHWMSDVAAAGLIGIVCAEFVVWVKKRIAA